MVCECRRGLTFEPRREVLRGDLVLPFPRGGQEAEHAPSRRVATERVLRCRCGRRRRRRLRCRSLAPDHGCAHERAGQADAERAPEGVRGEGHDVTPCEGCAGGGSRGMCRSAGAYVPRPRNPGAGPAYRTLALAGRRSRRLRRAAKTYACKALASPHSPRGTWQPDCNPWDGGVVPRRPEISRHVTSQLRAADRL